MGKCADRGTNKCLISEFGGCDSLVAMAIDAGAPAVRS